MLTEFELTCFDLSFDFDRIIFSFFFTFSANADSGVTFDTDDCTPAFAVLSFINRCHSPTLCVWGLVGWRAG